MSHTSFTPSVTPRSSSVPLETLERVDRLADEEESNLEVFNSIRNQAHSKKHVSSTLDTDQIEGITQKLKFATRQLNDRIELHTSGVSDEFRELTITPEHDQTLVNQSNVFPAPPQATILLQQVSQRKCPNPYPKDNPEEEIEVHQEQVYEDCNIEERL